MAQPDGLEYLEPVIDIIMNAAGGIIAREFAQRIATEVISYLRSLLGPTPESVAATHEIRANAGNILALCDKLPSG